VSHESKDIELDFGNGVRVNGRIDLVKKEEVNLFTSKYEETSTPSDYEIEMAGDLFIQQQIDLNRGK
jgi:hypothetical protein